jgi:alpha-1,6-mannosyltransferase
MSPDGPLGATPRSGAFELRHASAAARVRTRARLGYVGLAGMFVTCLIMCVSAPATDNLLPESVRPLPKFLAGPFGFGGPRLATGVLMALLTTMFCCYVLVIRAADRIALRHVLMVIAALLALVMLAPPLLSTDVFSYQAYGRMWTAYGANPYLIAPQHVLQSGPLFSDPLYSYIGAKWVNTASSYGPLFTLLSAPLANLSPNEHVAIAANALAYKAIAALSCLGIIALLWNAARMRGLNPIRGVALFGLNPLVVLYGVGGGHNDLLMLLLTTAGVYALLAHRERASGALIAVGAGIKLTGLLLLPFALASGVELGAKKRRRSILIGAAIAAAAIAAVGFAVFGAGQLALFSTLSKVQQEGDWHSVPGFLNLGLGLGTLSRITGLVLAVVFVVVFVLLLRRVLRGEMDWIDGAAWATLAMLLTASSLLPWYVAWLLPLVALGTDRRLWRYALIFTGWMQFITMLGYIPHVYSLVRM